MAPDEPPTSGTSDPEPDPTTAVNPDFGAEAEAEAVRLLGRVSAMLAGSNFPRLEQIIGDLQALLQLRRQDPEFTARFGPVVPYLQRLVAIPRALAFYRVGNREAMREVLLAVPAGPLADVPHLEEIIPEVEDLRARWSATLLRADLSETTE